MLSIKPWKPERVVWLFGALLAAYMLSIFTVQGYRWALGSDAANAVPNVWLLLLGTFMTHGLALILVALFLREQAIPWSDAFGFKKERITRTILLAILTTLIVLPIALGLNELCRLALVRLFGNATPQGAVATLQKAVSISEYLYLGVMAILTAPIVEEIIFRGIVYPTIKQEGFVKTAVWATALLFAWSHFNLMTFVPLMFLSVILTLLYETTDNLLAPILTHSLFNAANFFWMIFQMRG